MYIFLAWQPFITLDLLESIRSISETVLEETAGKSAFFLTVYSKKVSRPSWQRGNPISRDIA